MSHHSTERLLLVDDDPLMRRTAKRVIERRLGVRVTAVGGADDALAQIRGGERFDVAVVDLEMPGVDGLALLDRLRRLAPDLPAGLWSGSDRLHEVGPGSAAFLVAKTQPIGDLLLAVELVLEAEAGRTALRRSGVVPRPGRASEDGGNGGSRCG
ncbi:MAG TPA: response regulator [Sandaracinaceae bacterium LLY-WYZ-13_1]|nr:response regulator [Sandaracinaceae bacterium LLY-WYZ-13_1]